MNHDEAVKMMGTEQYLLGELAPEQREQFEEHLFECAECASDVRAGALFLEHSKAILAAEGEALPGPVVAAGGEKSRWAWLRPAIAVPVFAMLLAVIAYQDWPSHKSPQVLQAAYVNIGSRGGAVPAISAAQDQGFLLRVGLPPDRIYSSRLVDIYGPDGKLRWSLSLLSNQEDDNYFIHVPAGRYVEGTYSVAVRGTGPDGNNTELGRSSFDLHVVK